MAFLFRKCWFFLQVNICRRAQLPNFRKFLCNTFSWQSPIKSNSFNGVCLHFSWPLTSVCVPVFMCVWLFYFLPFLSFFSVCLFGWLSVYQYVCLFYFFVSICLSVCQFVCLYIYLYASLSDYLSVCQSICLHVSFSFFLSLSPISQFYVSVFPYRFLSIFYHKYQRAPARPSY